MASIVQRVSDVAARIVLKPATVGAVTEHDGFRTIELVGERLRNLDWVPGDKLRVRTDGLTLRTYTPTAWDGERGSTRLLAYVHGPGPGSEWCRVAQPGDECQLLGPDHSVRLDRLTAAPIFVGDETSFGLLLAWRAFPADLAPPAALFEVTDDDASQSTLHDHGCDSAELVIRRADDGHLDDLAERVVGAARAHPRAPLCITGRAQAIAVVRRALKAASLAPAATLVKAYWDVNRKGLD